MLFVSHSSTDAQHTRRLVFELLRLNVPIWLDEFYLNAGTRVYEEIENNIQKAQAVVFMLSEVALSSPYVTDEIRLAQKYSRPIVPIRLPGLPLQSIPVDLQQYKIYSLNDKSNPRAIAYQVANTLQSAESNDTARKLWIRDPHNTFSGNSEMELSIASFDDLSDTEYSLRLFDSEFNDLTELSSAATSIILPDFELESSRRFFENEITNLSLRVSKATQSIQQALTNFAITKKTPYDECRLKAFISALLQAVQLDIDKVYAIKEGTTEAADTHQLRRSAWQLAQIFDGSVIMELIVDGASLGKMKAPSYVEPIDLPPKAGGFKGTSVLLKHDLGSASGWLLGLQTWVGIKQNDKKLQQTPAMDEISVGLA